MKITSIKEVLHLYYGCDFEHQDDFFVLTRHKVNGYYIDRWNDNCILFLRPLTTMTDEEAQELCSIFMESPFNGRCSAGWIFERGTVGKNCSATYLQLTHPKNEHSFNIDLTDGAVTAWEGGDRCPNFDPALCVAYLLKKGFDLFNLIPRKLAEKWTPDPVVIVD